MTKKLLLLGLLGLLLGGGGWLFFSRRHTPTLTDAVIARSVEALTLEPRDIVLTVTAKDSPHLCVRLESVVKDNTDVDVLWSRGGKPLAANFHWRADSDGDGWIQFPIPMRALEPGDYRLDIQLDGQIKKTLKLTVKEPN